MEQIIAKLENDVRNELHSVMGMLELIARGPLTQAQSEYLRSCKASADHLLRSIQNVSAFLSSDADAARTAIFDLHEVLANLTNLMKALAARKGLNLSLEIRPGVPTRIAGDPDRLQDILVRLLDNAIRFTDHGEVRLIVTEATSKSTEVRLQFDVCDTGPGIANDIVARLSNPLSEEVALSGLGLPIVRKLVLSMNGDLTIASEEGGGSHVTVGAPFRTLPADDSVAEHCTPNTIPPLNILVAEDSDDSYYVLEGYLREQQHRLTRAVNGVRAVELFTTGQYDLVLMDIHMPDMDGYAATRAIRTWETGCARARVPIVVLSSDSPATQIQNGAKVGCSAYLTKPVSHAALVNVLNRYTVRTSNAGDKRTMELHRDSKDR